MQISIRELKANPAYAISLTQQGERVQITSHRKVIAELVQPTDRSARESGVTDRDAMQKLLASGLVAEHATKPFKLGKAVVFPTGLDATTMGDTVIQLRGPK